jgi:hypothetical protein
MNNWNVERIDEAIERLQEQRKTALKFDEINHNTITKISTNVGNEFIFIQESKDDRNTYDVWLELSNIKVYTDKWIEWLESGWYQGAYSLNKYSDSRYTFKNVPKNEVFDLIIQHNR